MKIDIFGGHEVLKLYFMCSKNSISIFQRGITIFGPNFSYLFLKQSLFYSFRKNRLQMGCIFWKRWPAFDWCIRSLSQYPWRTCSVWGSLISEGILTLGALPTKGAKSLPWAEILNKLFTLKFKGWEIQTFWSGARFGNVYCQWNQSQNTFWD